MRRSPKGSRLRSERTSYAVLSLERCAITTGAGIALSYANPNVLTTTEEC